MNLNPELLNGEELIHYADRTDPWVAELISYIDDLENEVEGLTQEVEKLFNDESTRVEELEEELAMVKKRLRALADG